VRSGRPCGPRTRLGRAAARERRPRATVTRARASSAPAGQTRRPRGLLAAQFRFELVRCGSVEPPLRAHETAARVWPKQASETPAIRRPPFGTGSSGAERQGSPDCGKRRRLQATTSETIGSAPAATCDRLAQRHHRIRRGTFRPGVPTQIRDFAPPLCRPRFRRNRKLSVRSRLGECERAGTRADR